MKFSKPHAETPRAPRPPKAPKAPKAPKRARAAEEGRKASGAAKFVLLLGDEGAILVYLQGKTVVRRLFAQSPQPDHAAVLLELLAAHPATPLYVLADVIDQQYVRHSFPPVSALTINNLVKRRLERDFQAEDITGAIRLGREKSGRKEWQYLLVALAYTPLLQQWLDLLVEQPNELKGIYLTPVEGQNYIPQLHNAMTSARPLPWQILVSHHKISGFRQIVLQNGKLVFTRITQAIDDAVPAVIAGNIEQEIMNTLEYLRRLGFTDNATAELLVIASPDVKETLDLNRFAAGQAWTMTPLEVAEALDLQQAALSADRFGDVVMAAAFARAKKRHLKLMTAYAAKLTQLYAARRAVKLLGGLAVLAVLGMAAMNVVGAMGARSAAATTEAQRAPVQTQLNTVRQALSGLNADVAFKSAIMLTHDAYFDKAELPAKFIDTLAPLLTEATRVRKITWGSETASSGASGAAAPNAAPAPGMPGVAPASAPVEAVPVAVEMEMIGTFADTKALAEFVEAFLGRLKAEMPDYEVTHNPFPWESATPQNLEISFDRAAEQPTGLKEGENRITLQFRTRSAAPETSGAPGVPFGMPPGMGMGMGMPQPGGRP